jgi:hypothetical protein
MLVHTHPSLSSADVLADDLLGPLVVAVLNRVWSMFTTASRARPATLVPLGGFPVPTTVATGAASFRPWPTARPDGCELLTMRNSPWSEAVSVMYWMSVT